MRDATPNDLSGLLSRLRTTLLTEAAFRDEITTVFKAIEEKGLRIAVTVSAGGREVASYGERTGTPHEAQPVAIEPLNCQITGASPKGNTPQDLALASDVWREVVGDVNHVVQEHWRAREPSRAVWSGQDPSVQKKRERTVSEAVQRHEPVAYVRLDCDGFGAVKQRLGGEQLADQVIQNIGDFLRQNLWDHSLVFHPHGDEFELIFINQKPRDVIARLLDFQRGFEVHDFRPLSVREEVTLGIRMAVSFWPSDQGDGNPNSIYDLLRQEAEAIDFKGRSDRGFIEVAGPEPEVGEPLDQQAMAEIVLWAYTGLALPEVVIFGDGLHDQIAQWLVDHSDPAVSLTEQLDRFAKKFVLRTFGGAMPSSHATPARPVASRFIPIGKLAAIMLHILLKRRFLGRGPLTPKDRLRLSFSGRTGRRSGTLSVERKVQQRWEMVFSFSDAQIDRLAKIDAGQVWLPSNASLQGQTGLLTRWCPEAPQVNDLSPCLVVLVGNKARALRGQLGRWAAAVLEMDDRPVTSGHLPDFWQTNVARTVAECLRNPNIRAIILVRDEPDTVKRTREVMLGACQMGGAGIPAAKRTAAWSDDRISEIALATALREPSLRHFRDRQIQLVEVTAELGEVTKAILTVYSDDPCNLAAKGVPELFDWREDHSPPSSQVQHGFTATNLRTVFPEVIRALRSRDTPRYQEHNGQHLAELTGVRVELQTPNEDDIPGYWEAERTEFEAYYARAFGGSSSLFGSRFCKWGGATRKSGQIDQCDRAVHTAADAITQGRVDRRIILVTAQPPGTANSDPLGLTSVHVFPRLRSDSKSWVLDFLWVWRSVEAIVGFPFSVYGSVRFSHDILKPVNDVVPPRMRPIRFGTVTYIALSLHLYCDKADLMIARHIDLEARP